MNTKEILDILEVHQKAFHHMVLTYRQANYTTAAEICLRLEELLSNLREALKR